MKLNAVIRKVKPGQALIEVDTEKLVSNMPIIITAGKTRSNPQNSLYWSMLEIIQEDTGYTKDELHEMFKQTFLGDKIEVLGTPFIFSRSTTKLKKDEFTKYLTDIRYFVLDKLGINLPLD